MSLSRRVLPVGGRTEKPTAAAAWSAEGDAMGNAAMIERVKGAAVDPEALSLHVEQAAAGVDQGAHEVGHDSPLGQEHTMTREDARGGVASISGAGAEADQRSGRLFQSSRYGGTFGGDRVTSRGGGGNPFFGQGKHTGHGGSPVRGSGKEQASSGIEDYLDADGNWTGTAEEAQQWANAMNAGTDAAGPDTRSADAIENDANMDALIMMEGEDSVYVVPEGPSGSEEGPPGSGKGDDEMPSENDHGGGQSGPLPGERAGAFAGRALGVRGKAGGRGDGRGDQQSRGGHGQHDDKLIFGRSGGATDKEEGEGGGTVDWDAVLRANTVTDPTNGS